MFDRPILVLSSRLAKNMCTPGSLRRSFPTFEDMSGTDAAASYRIAQ
jgi:hypothetical protein